VADALPAEISVRYFAAAAEAAGVEAETLALPEPTLGALQDALLERYGEPMSRVLRSGSFLVAGVVRRDRATALTGTVDVLPPFAGG
jgi:molybdopterin converting factor small subunit